MSEFEKSLEESCNKINNSMSGDLEYGFQKGARWAREFTVGEICEWIVGDGQFIVRNHCPANLKMAIESHFKDRGGE